MAKFEIGNKFSVGLENTGHPPIYKDVDSLIEKINEYFDLEGKKTTCELALFLGFASRQSLYDYKGNPEYSYIIKRALLVIENGYEERLTESNATGSIFALKNMGWKDSQSIDQTITDKSEKQIIEIYDYSKK